MRPENAGEDRECRNRQRCRVETRHRRKSAILVAQSEFVKATMQHQRLEDVDQEREQNQTATIRSSHQNGAYWNRFQASSFVSM